MGTPTKTLLIHLALYHVCERMRVALICYEYTVKDYFAWGSFNPSFRKGWCVLEEKAKVRKSTDGASNAAAVKITRHIRRTSLRI